MNFSKDIKQAWAILISEICFVAIGGINVGFGIFRQMSGKNGIMSICCGAFCAIVCGVCACFTCRTLIRYARMEKDVEQIQKMEQYCQRIKQVHDNMFGNNREIQ